MRVLIVEDNPEKYYDIKSALSQLGIRDVSLTESVNEATLSVLEQKEKETPYDLIISDMQFPLFSSGKPVDDAGMEFIGELHELGITTPVKLCIVVCLEWKKRGNNHYTCVVY